MTYQQNVVNGNRAAVITANDEAGPFRCRIWVNVRDGIVNGDATLTAYKCKTLRAALKWANHQLGGVA